MAEQWQWFIEKLARSFVHWNVFGAYGIFLGFAGARVILQQWSGDYSQCLLVNLEDQFVRR